MKPNLISGLTVMSVGILGVILSQNYNVGTLTNMGPGFFPLMLSVILSLLGVAITLKSFFEKSESVVIKWRSLLAITSSILIFGILLVNFGLIISTVASVLVSTMIIDISIRKKLYLILGLSIVNLLIFGLILQIPLKII